MLQFIHYEGHHTLNEVLLSSFYRLIIGNEGYITPYEGYINPFEGYFTHPMGILSLKKDFYQKFMRIIPKKCRIVNFYYYF